MLKEQTSITSIASTLAAAVRTSDADGTGVDLKGYESALVVAVVGPEGDTLASDLAISLELEESDDNVTFTDVAAADMKVESPAIAGSSGQFLLCDTGTEAPAVAAISYLGTKRYIRGVYNVIGTHSNGTLCAVFVVRGHPRSAPVT